MAVSDDGTPLFDELSGVETKPEKNAGKPAEQRRSTGTALIRSVDQPASLHRMHEGRIVRPAGRMLVGSPVPIPTLDDVLNETPMFSGRKQRQWSISGGAAVALACAVAIGSAVALTGVLSKTTSRKAAAGEDDRLAAELPAGPAVQSLAVSEAQAGPGAASASRPAGPQTVQSIETPRQRLAAQEPGSFAVRNITGMAGEALPLQINVPQGQPEEYSFLMFRGLPADVSISAGFRLKESWAVSLRDLDTLTLQTSPNFEGRFNLEVLLIKGREAPAESRVLAVSIQKPGARSPAVAQAGGSQILTATPPANSLQPVEKQVATIQQPARAAVPPQRVIAAPPAGELDAPKPSPGQSGPSISAEDENPLLEKAARLLTNYDVSSARLLFEHLATRGSAKAALALGQTYDPVFFRTAAIKGMQPNVAKAKEWYKKAADLGSDEAASRLSAIDAR